MFEGVCGWCGAVWASGWVNRYVEYRRPERSHCSVMQKGLHEKGKPHLKQSWTWHFPGWKNEKCLVGITRLQRHRVETQLFISTHLHKYTYCNSSKTRKQIFNYLGFLAFVWFCIVLSCPGLKLEQKIEQLDVWNIINNNVNPICL